MGGLLRGVVVISACLALLASLVSVLGLAQQVGRAAQVSTAMGIDVDPTDNSATSLRDIDACVSVAAGQSFDVDIFITDVVDLKGWQGELKYEPSVLQVIEADVELFLAEPERGRILNLSDFVPDQDGSFSLAVVDMVDVGHSGSGVLARITLEAVGTGSSFLTLEEIKLANPAARPIGDSNFDTWFDGAVGHAQVWVDEPCPSSLPTPPPSPTPTVRPQLTPSSVPTFTPSPAPGEPASPGATPAISVPTEDEDNGGFPWAIVSGTIAGAAVVALALGFVFGRLLQRG